MLISFLNLWCLWQDKGLVEIDGISKNYRMIKLSSLKLEGAVIRKFKNSQIHFFTSMDSCNTLQSDITIHILYNSFNFEERQFMRETCKSLIFCIIIPLTFEVGNLFIWLFLLIFSFVWTKGGVNFSFFKNLPSNGDCWVTVMAKMTLKYCDKNFNSRIQFLAQFSTSYCHRKPDNYGSINLQRMRREGGIKKICFEVLEDH